VQYEDRHGTVTEREIELRFLYYNLPVWYAMAWDLLRDDIRSFRIDRIRHLGVLPTTFRLRPPDPFVAAGEATARTMGTPSTRPGCRFQKGGNHPPGPDHSHELTQRGVREP
jgi:predicted DNA-binding transcriptional regulator YafY